MMNEFGVLFRNPIPKYSVNKLDKEQPLACSLTRGASNHAPVGSYFGLPRILVTSSFLINAHLGGREES